MINKLLLNNLIISNKKKIQQGRVQTINKLVQKIRKLKKLSEKKPDNDKITEHLQKVPKIMACVKKLKSSDIVRQILLLSKKPAAILTNGQASSEDTALALLASNKIIADIVMGLKMQLNLDDGNPGWKEEVTELSRKKKNILKGAKLKKDRKEKVVQKLVAKKPAPWIEEDADTENIVVEDDIASEKGWHVEPLNNGVKEVPIKQTPSKENSETEIPQDIEAKPKLNPPHQQTFKKPVTTVDSFFFTEAGDNYVSTVVIDPNISDKPDENPKDFHNRRDGSIRQLQGHKPRRQSIQHGRVEKRQNFPPSSKAQPPKSEEKLHPSWAAKQKLKPTISQFKGQKITFGDDGVKSISAPKVNHKERVTKPTQSEENLHPSWAAKQKLKPAITEFKGKKITFDD